MSPRSRERFKGRRQSGTFFLAPTDVLDSPAFCGLTSKACKLLLDLGSQYRGGNNGDLAAPWSFMCKRGWKSKDTLRNALLELLATGMIEQTRHGGLWLGPNLYAFTWIEIHDCGGKLEGQANPVPSGKWRRAQLKAVA